MANINIGNPLKRHINGKTEHIATVEDIAYSTKLEGSGIYQYEAIQQSLKDVIDEIKESIKDTENIDVEALQQQISNLTELSSVINQNISKAENSAAAAKRSADLAESYAETLRQVNEIAKDLQTSLTAEALIQIMPEANYNSNTALDNTLYICI